MYAYLIGLVVFLSTSSMALAQSASPGSAPLGGDAVCPEMIDVYVIDDLIAEAGGIQALYDLSTAQIAEYDRWLVEMEGVMGQGVREAELAELYEMGIANRQLEVQLSEALECRMGM